MAKKPSFFDRLTGANFDSDYTDYAPQPQHQQHGHHGAHQPYPQHAPYPQPQQQQQSQYPQDYPDASHVATFEDAPQEEAQLTVDVYQTPDAIIIQALVAGVRPDELDISIGRDIVTIRGKRQTEELVEDHGYVYRELFWGAFARTIVLPAEIDLDQAEASQKHGLLTIKLPKINKARQAKLRVRG